MKRSTEWLAENAGKYFDFGFGLVTYNAKLEHNKRLGYYFFRAMGIEHDARICQIYTND